MVIGRTHTILVVKYMATRGRDRPSTSKVHVCVVRNMEQSQLTACVDVIGMLGDILSMDVYRSYPIVLHLHSECLQATLIPANQSKRCFHEVPELSR